MLTHLFTPVNAKLRATGVVTLNVLIVLAIFGLIGILLLGSPWLKALAVAYVWLP